MAITDKLRCRCNTCCFIQVCQRGQIYYSFVRSKSDSYATLFTAMLYAIPCYIGSCYTDTRQNQHKLSTMAFISRWSQSTWLAIWVRIVIYSLDIPTGTTTANEEYSCRRGGFNIGYFLTSIGTLMIKIKRSHDRLIFIMWISKILKTVLCWNGT